MSCLEGQLPEGTGIVCIKINRSVGGEYSPYSGTARVISRDKLQFYQGLTLTFFFRLPGRASAIQIYLPEQHIYLPGIIISG